MNLRVVSVVSRNGFTSPMKAGGVHSRGECPRKERAYFDVACGKFRLRLGERTHLMGILNVTPDSFSDGGLYFDRDAAIEHALRMAHEGADIIDIGGESTRPGSLPVDPKEEIRRVIPVIKRLVKLIKIPLSIDTNKSEVVKRALDEGVSMVNDIMGLKGNPKLARVVARYKVPIIIMHIKGKPRTMQQHPQYKGLISEIFSSLKHSINTALEAGIREEGILVDPGIGFGKTIEHNLEILNRLSEFKRLGRPIVVGTSRKSFIGNILRIPDTNQRLMGTAATVALTIAGGAHVVRVHDVGPMVEVARMTDAISQAL